MWGCEHYQPEALAREACNCKLLPRWRFGLVFHHQSMIAASPPDLVP